MKGQVYLVGAGPGRPDLLTLRGAQCLARADAVVVDALVNKKILRHCPPGARVIDAGKRGHSRAAMSQARINRLLVKLARQGKTVVRLKGGDPAFFGRGGEELEFILRRGISAEVVPGVSSVGAAPIYGGVPLTHRDHTSMVTVITGHFRDDALQKGIDWERLSPQGTLVILMGVKSLPAIARRLVQTGWAPSTPAAAVQWGTLPFQKQVTGTLQTIAGLLKKSGLGAPAVIVVGEVARLGRSLDWFRKKPLFGRTILVTRTQEQASELSDELQAQGALVIESPTIEIRPLAARGGKYFARLKDYDAVLLTSANAVRFFAIEWKRRHHDWPASVKIYAVGPKTAQAILAAGLPLSAVAQEFIAESLLNLVAPKKGRRFLLPQAREARDVLAAGIKAAGARVDVWPLYATRPRRIPPDVKKALLAGALDCVTFTSSSTVNNFLAAFNARERRKIFAKTWAASIGPVTTAALKSRGAHPRIAARRSTIEDLCGAITRALPRKPKNRAQFPAAAHLFDRETPA